MIISTEVMRSTKTSMTIRHRMRAPYLEIWEEMKQFTTHRSEGTCDELWLLEHSPVYTQGQAGKASHILRQNNIPIVQSDRGGQITYHGPGQLVAYVLFDLRRRNLGIRTFVQQLEQILIDLLASYAINAERQCGAPGVYVAGKKIASIGLRVKNGCTYHGIALNVSMDLKPFQDINPCGFNGLVMTQIQDHLPGISLPDVQEQLSNLFTRQFA